MTYELSQVRNLRRCGHTVADTLQTNAVIAEIMEGWDFRAVTATAHAGASEADVEMIERITRRA